MGNILPGIIYIALCWTGIPSILGLVEGIIYLIDDDAKFQERVEAKNFFF
jgi:TM2 domain-containing membrane protein YozV